LLKAQIGFNKFDIAGNHGRFQINAQQYEEIKRANESEVVQKPIMVREKAVASMIDWITSPKKAALEMLEKAMAKIDHLPKINNKTGGFVRFKCESAKKILDLLKQTDVSISSDPEHVSIHDEEIGDLILERLKAFGLKKTMDKNGLCVNEIQLGLSTNSLVIFIRKSF